MWSGPVTHPLVAKLRGTDRRSIGRSEEVVGSVLADPGQFRTFAMQALADLAERDEQMRRWVRPLLALTRIGTPAMRTAAASSRPPGAAPAAGRPQAGPLPRAAAGGLKSRRRVRCRMRSGDAQGTRQPSTTLTCRDGDYGVLPYASW
jgi:hypothetical protein